MLCIVLVFDDKYKNNLKVEKIYIIDINGKNGEII